MLIGCLIILACSDQIVNNKNVASGGDSALLHVERVLLQSIQSKDIPLHSMSPQLTAPYSFSYVTVVHLPGSFPFFLTGTNAAPSRNAITGPRRNPLASKPTIVSIFFDSSFGIVSDVMWCTICVISVSNAMGFRSMGNRSRNVIP